MDSNPTGEDNTMNKTLARERMASRDCIYCGANGTESLAYGTLEVDGQQIMQKVTCMVCDRPFYEVYSFAGVATDKQEEIFER